MIEELRKSARENRALGMRSLEERLVKLERTIDALFNIKEVYVEHPGPGDLVVVKTMGGVVASERHATMVKQLESLLPGCRVLLIDGDRVDVSIIRMESHERQSQEAVAVDGSGSGGGSDVRVDASDQAD